MMRELGNEVLRNTFGPKKK